MVMVLVMVLTTMAAEAINKCPTKWEQHSPHPFLHIIKHTHTPDAKTTSRGLGEDGDRTREGGKSEKLSTLFPGLEDGISEGLWEQLRVRVCTWIFRPRLVPA